MKSFVKCLSVLSLVFVLGACGAIPSQYRGSYQGSNGTILKLGGTNGVLTSQREIIKSKAKPMEFQDLLEGLPGIYVRPNPTNPKLLDVFWLRPKMQTKQEGGGMVWYTSEIYYSLFDATQKKVKANTVRLIHSDEGSVMLDLQTGLFQVGWPASPREVVFTRIKK